MYETRHLSVSIQRPWREVYDFAAEPTNLPQWAAGLAHAEVRRGEDGRWGTDSPMGRVTIEFAEPNPFGVLDHDVTLPSGETVANPLRVAPNDDGCDVVFTVHRRSGMSDEDFERDAAAVAADLATLRQLMQS